MSLGHDPSFSVSSSSERGPGRAGPGTSLPPGWLGPGFKKKKVFTNEEGLVPFCWDFCSGSLTPVFSFVSSKIASSSGGVQLIFFFFLVGALSQFPSHFLLCISLLLFS